MYLNALTASNRLDNLYQLIRKLDRQGVNMEFQMRLARPTLHRQVSKHRRYGGQEQRFVWAILGIVLLFFAIFFYYPFFRTIFYMFFSYDYITEPKFVALKNIDTLLHDAKAITAFKNTINITVVTVPLTIAIALIFAVIVFQMKMGKNLIRSALFATSLIPVIIAGIVFKAWFNEGNGFINTQLRYLGLATIPWLTDAYSAMLGIYILTVWRSIGYHMVILLAGLSNIDQTLYEAAMIDGANTMTRFEYITIPQLKNSLIVCAIVATINALASYEQVYILTQGGPYSSTTTATMYMFDLTVKSGKVGYASVIAVILFIIMLIVSLTQLRLTQANEN
jgi:ABC-type sugar transport system permease subunit